MERFLLLHGPHLAVALAAFAVVVVSALRAERQGGDGLVLGAAAVAEPAAAPAARPASRRISRLGLWALAPLGLALTTGVAIYALDVAGQRPGAILRIAHTLVSSLALAQVSWKVAAIGARRLRAALAGRHLASTLASLALALLGVPLLGTGAALLVAPSSGSALAYAHLIAAAWWTVLLGAHLLRHLPRALAVTGRR